jgi:hypothetical protein
VWLTRHCRSRTHIDSDNRSRTHRPRRPQKKQRRMSPTRFKDFGMGSGDQQPKADIRSSKLDTKATMSQLGHQRTFHDVRVASGLPVKADIRRQPFDVGFGPEAGIRLAAPLDNKDFGSFPGGRLRWTLKYQMATAIIPMATNQPICPHVIGRRPPQNSPSKAPRSYGNKHRGRGLFCGSTVWASFAFSQLRLPYLGGSIL